MATEQMSRAERYRQRRQQGVTWKAPSGEEIRVKRLSLTDTAVVGKLPSNLQQIVYRAIDASTKLKAAPSPDDVDIDDVFGDLDGKAKLDAMRETSVQLAKLGWIDPKLVDEVTDPETQIGVDEADADDLLAYMGYVMSGQQEEAAPLATFPERSPGGMGPRHDGPAVLAAAESGSGDPQSILRRDSV